MVIELKCRVGRDWIYGVMFLGLSFKCKKLMVTRSLNLGLAWVVVWLRIDLN
jgi:hypothetical protein